MFEAHLRRIGFWTAVVVPLGYPIALSIDAGEAKLAAVAGLIVLNIAALVVGHRYNDFLNHRGSSGNGGPGGSGAGS